MGLFVNPDNSAFAAALNARIYVDKSGLIRYTNDVLCSTDAFICSSRPRRFGKSTTADMLTAYYSRGCDSMKMFKHLEIGQDPGFQTPLNQFDVIHFDLQWCIEPAGSAGAVISYLTGAILSELRGLYPKELTASVNSVPEALSRINASTGKKFVIIIDEWDVLIRDEAANHAVQEEYIGFLRSLFKGNMPARYIALAYLTGILPIKKFKTQSALNNFDEFTMLSADAFAPYIGFTESEVKTLCETYGRDFTEAKRWYNGYLLENQQIYNPKAVVSLMTKGKYKSYWSETGSYEAIVPYINMNFDGLRTAVMEMLSGAAVRINCSSFQNDTVSFINKDDVLTYLIHLGYLGYDQDTRTAFVPNEEIRQQLSAAVQRNEWSDWSVFQMDSDQLLRNVWNHNADAVAAGIEKIHMEYASAIQYNDEEALSSVLAIAFLSSMKYYFKPVRELPSGKGFADFVYIPKPDFSREYPALLVELKWDTSASAAIRQIKEKQYPESLKAYTGDILLIGISYDKKTKEHHCVIEKL